MAAITRGPENPPIGLQCNYDESAHVPRRREDQRLTEHNTQEFPRTNGNFDIFSRTYP